MQHETGNRHKRNVQQFLRNLGRKTKDEARANKEAMRELARIQALVGGLGPIPAAAAAPSTRPPRESTEFKRQQEHDDEVEEAGAERAAKKAKEIDPDECAAAAEEYYRENFGESDESSAKEFARMAREFAVKEIDARKIAAGESAPMPGAWIAVEPTVEGEGEETRDETESHGDVAKVERRLPDRVDDDKDDEEVESLPGGVAMPRRPVGFKDEDDEKKPGDIGGDDDKGIVFKVSSRTKSKCFRKKGPVTD